MASPNDKAKNMLFDKRKGYRKGEFVRFVDGGLEGAGTLSALYHASATVRTDDGKTYLLNYGALIKI